MYVTGMVAASRAASGRVPDVHPLGQGGERRLPGRVEQHHLAVEQRVVDLLGQGRPAPGTRR